MLPDTQLIVAVQPSSAINSNQSFSISDTSSALRGDALIIDVSHTME